MTDIKPFVFVLMPFNKDFNDIYRLGIKQAAEEAGLRAERVDEQLYSESMLERIYQQISAADIVVADMTGQNPNVFYEVGYAHAKGKICILLTQNASDIPFDLKQHRHIVYEGSILTLKNQLGANLEWATSQVATAKTSGLTVKCKPQAGELKLFKSYAEGTTRLIIDIHNTADQAFGEIESVNLYVGKGWRFSQNGQEASKTDSDDPRFSVRHAFVPQMRRINPKGWTQLTAVGTKVLAWASGDSPLKDSYTITGRVMIRIVTATRSYDFESTLEVDFDDIPF
ncbi:nucleoside 2-deoxyribosyltransferase [Achromobacter animicus]